MRGADEADCSESLNPPSRDSFFSFQNKIPSSFESNPIGITSLLRLLIPLGSRTSFLVKNCERFYKADICRTASLFQMILTMFCHFRASSPRQPR